MSDQNICKFPSLSFPDSLSIRCFVRESDAERMERASTLTAHRVLLVTSGQGELCFDGQSYSVRAGTLFFCFEGEQFRAVCAPGSAYLYIDFSGHRANELLRRFEIREGNRRFDSFDSLIPLWTETLSRSSEETVDLAAEGLLLHAFSRFSMEGFKRNDLIGGVLKKTDERFQNPTLSISDLARELNYNPKYLSHLFREKMGVTYSEYLRSLRVRYAASLFDHGIDSVKNVALLSGFTDPLYFSGVFKRQVGVSPTEYLKQTKQEEK